MSKLLETKPLQKTVSGKCLICEINTVYISTVHKCDGYMAEQLIISGP